MSTRSLRLDVLLAVHVLGESGPTKVAKLISDWRRQPVGRNAAGDHLVRLRKQGYLIGKKRRLKDRIEDRYVNSHAFAAYTLTDRGRRETDEIARWLRAVYASIERRLVDDIFA
jgi:hypothetical protein